MQTKDKDHKNGGKEWLYLSKDPRGMKPWNPECLNPAFNLNHPSEGVREYDRKAEETAFRYSQGNGGGS
jgi:hypothetical protein